jgi:diguanylate cyclase (GGDEF)-like protein/PAS domain S-box-containing protein
MGAPDISSSPVRSGGVLTAVAFATRTLLSEDGWPSRTDEILACLGAALEVDAVDLRRDGAPGEEIPGSVLEVPVTVGEERWGTLSAATAVLEREWTDTERAGLQAVAATIAAAIGRARDADMDRYADQRYRSIIEQIPVVSYIDALDERASSVFISPQVEALTGYSQREWLEDPDLWPRLLHPDDRARALAENVRHNETGEPFVADYRLIARDERVVWIHDEARVVFDPESGTRYSHGVMFDATDRKRTEEQVAFHAYHDDLTGLPSRAMFDELLELSIARARRHEGAVAVVCVDLDDFRLVNDSLGHANGDELLKVVADRLREATRETDLVARRGGDQFLLLLSDLDREAEGIEGAMLRAESVAQRVTESMGLPFEVNGTELYLSASVGISLFPNDAADAGGLIRNAETAMYEAKKTGRGGYVVSSEGTFDSAAKLQFVTRLRKAVDTQRWVLHYQPILELDTGQMVGVEALIRWIEPDGTLVPPVEFIPLAEELGLIELIGDWVVRELVFQVQAWRDLGVDLEVGFNLSPRQFWQPDLAERILDRFEAGGIDARRVLVEITESSAMLDPDRAQEILWSLHAGGLRIAIDDFGTGYSSLSRLREMPVGVLKIDRSFVHDVHRDPQAASIVSAFLELAKGLGMTTLAEGIETPEELQFLRERGCRLGQGFLFSKPVPPEEIISFAIAGVPAAAGLRVD